MSIETFRAPTMREALSLVRQRLGGAAVVLGSREIAGRGGLLTGRRVEVEVTAELPSPAECRRSLPASRAQALEWLVDVGLEEAQARSLLFAADELGRRESLESRLLQCVESQLHCSGELRLEPGQRRVVALAGPAGAGTTTTIAKLAASLHCSGRARVALIDIDPHWRGGSETSLASYAGVLGLPLTTVASRNDLVAALEEFADVDLVLVDTACRGPREDIRIHELKDLLAQAPIDELHLVVSAASSQRSLIAAVERFRLLRPTDMVLTKLDEAPGLGAIYSAARGIDLPLSYFTMGQDIPDDLEPARLERTARLILGLDPLRALHRRQS